MLRKNHFPFVLAAFLTVCLVLAASSAMAQLFEYEPARPPAAEFVPGEILVRFKPGVDAKEVAGINERLGAISARLTYSGAHRVNVPEKMLARLLEAYKMEPAVEYAEPNYVRTIFMEPNDPYYSYQWHMDNAVYGGIQMEDAWDIQTGSSSVVVAVVDTGVAYENYRKRWKRYYLAPDLANTTFVAGYDFVENDTHPNDDNAHGTHVTGTIAQTTNNGIGCAGVAFSTAIMPVKVLDRNGSGTDADVADGIQWATDHGANVINLSLGGPDPSTTLKNAVAYAYNNGVTVIAAAGNDGKGIVSYPAAYDDYVIAVGATQYDEALAPYSNYGSSLDLIAPGGNINLDQNGDGYGDGVLQNTFNPNSKNTKDFGYWFFQGTSMAAPHVSGVAALLIAEGVATTPDAVREALQSTAEDKGLVGWDPEYGWGIVDAAAALGVAPPPPPVAGFVGDPTSGDAPLTVQFTDQSTGNITDWSWDFGDGGTSTDQNPSHTYQDAGDYTVSLTVTGPGGSDTASKTNYIRVTAPLPPVAAFSGSPTSGDAPLTVNFTDESTGDITSWSWDFGDGGTSTDQNPSHTYQDAGDYTVSLTVTGPGGSDTASKTNYIHVTAPPPPVAAFSGSPTSGDAPLTVNFTDESTGDITSWSWTFGDGGTSTDQNPSHTYENAGDYTVSLTVTGPGGSDAETKTNYIHVEAPSAPTAYVTVDMSKRTIWKWWRVTADITVTEGDAPGGSPIEGATVEGDWSGVYSGSVSGTTDKNGVVSFRTGWITKTGTVTFTVDRVVKDSQECILSGETSDSITNGASAGRESVLGQNSPNPFNPDTWIPFVIGESCKVTIRIYDVTGKLVRTLDLGHLDAGVYVDRDKAAYWDGRNESGEEATSGIYFYLMEAGSFRAMKKLVILK